MDSIELEQQLKALPTNPGVYLFKDNEDKVIYIGKAIKLSNRIRSYFGAPSSLPANIQQLVSKINSFEFIVTNSEQEALILECNLIKKYQPHYNVRLKDSKTFPYLKVNVNEEWPGVYITRRVRNDGARYFGPFASAGSVRKTLRVVKKIFPFRSCTKPINDKNKRPCLDYYIHRCLGPCTGAVSKKEYQEVIEQLILFLEGKQEPLLRELKQKMAEASRQLQFEKASIFRDQIRAIEKVIEGGKISITLKGEQDVIALAQDNGQALINIFFIRNNKLVGRNQFIMEGVYGEGHSQVMTHFVKQYYASASHIPPLILLQHPINEMPVLSDWLKQRRGGNIKLQLPQRGRKKQLIDMVFEDAEKSLELVKAKQMNPEVILAALHELKDRLGLPKIPFRIESYDISDIQGTLAVGSMVVFEKGLPKLTHYRRFRVKTISGADDYAMLREILRRRLKRGINSRGSWAITPDLILIDGGKGQLNAALEVRKELGMDSLFMASLAKEYEKVFIPDQVAPVDIPRDSHALHILQRARDEAHRFAISYHQNLRSKKSFTSILDIIPGIGPKRKRALVKKFGSIEAIRDASPEKISQTKGITLNLAKTIKEYL
ncbi:MAG: excinuclease ABC subunit UvrC [Chloroflexota bacterium]|nr:excinuclease ABC subunit UvrC [Chloroflexota bacterium]